MFFKVVSKILANRLKHYLEKCIAPEQAAFVEFRFITWLLRTYEVEEKRKGWRSSSKAEHE